MYTFSPVVVAAADLVAVVTVQRCSIHLEEGMLSSIDEVLLEAGTAGLLMVETVAVAQLDHKDQEEVFQYRCHSEFLQYVLAVEVPEIDMAEEKEEDTKRVDCP